MPKYLAIAEKVYKEIKKDNLFTEDTIQNLNCLISLIRKAIKGTEFKLKYNFINFEECLNQFNKEKSVHIDLSLMPKFKNEDEFILWLAGFIERMTIEGKRSFLQFQTIFQKALKLIKPKFLWLLNQAKKKMLRWLLTTLNLRISLKIIKYPLKYRSICPPYFYIWLIIFSYRLLGRFFYLTSLNDQHIKLIKMSVNMEMFYKELIMT